jgi:ATP-binding cassette subfamily F protein 3
MEDYIDFVLGRNQPKEDGKGAGKKDRKMSAQDKEAVRDLRSKVVQLEKAIARLHAECAEIDEALIDPSTAHGPLTRLSKAELGQRRAALTSELETVETQWLEASADLEALG